MLEISWETIASLDRERLEDFIELVKGSEGDGKEKILKYLQELRNLILKARKIES